ncbi:hypothetical protein ACI7BZ_06610 [Xanthobacter sp. AM11]|uniref:hypothetical protein n=1 Tax=Xanthobacter sp. AM11 TaxID=3380643 RepID=UPI0039BED99A
MSLSPGLDPARLRRPLTLLLAALLLSAAGLFAVTVARLAFHAGWNRTIAGLAAGRDLPVVDTAPARVLLARAHFLMIRDRLDEAQPLVDRIARTGEPAIAVAALYDLANARLALAISHLERMQIDPAVPQVRLAKAAYRAALTRDPGFYDGKYNLDVAMRLVRDFPQIEGSAQDETQEAPKRLWTDLPGLPRGLP